MTSLVFIVANDIAEVAGSVGNKKDTGGRLCYSCSALHAQDFLHEAPNRFVAAARSLGM
jgi:hypothetical protein